jgi:serine/threonine-protein kinase
MEGLVFGQYRVTGVLGRGGMGVVYAARHMLLDRPAAVKVLHARLSADPEAVARFFNEARATTAIRHPGIVEIYDFGQTEDAAAFIVMEHLQGETLRARLERAPVGWSTALALVRQIAGALGAAHGKGIVHRDLKPENIFLVPDPEIPGSERIKLLDFGVAKLAGSAPGQNVTRTGTLIGTPMYMAPEQCRGVQIDARVDLYSLGCILFELCTGRPPFVREAYGDLLIAHIQEPPPAVSSLARGVPPEIDALVQRMLAKSPAERVQTTDELVQRIDTSKIGIKQIARAGRYPALARRFSLVDLDGLASLEGRKPADRKPAEDRGSPLRALWSERHPDRRAAELALTAHGQERREKRRTSAPQPDTLLSATGARSRTVVRAPRRRLAALGGVGVVGVALTLVLLFGRGDAPTRNATAPDAETSPVPPSTETLALPDREAPRPSEPTEAARHPAEPQGQVTISIFTEPPGARISGGGKDLGRTPRDVSLTQGDDEVRLELQLDGYQPHELVIHPTTDMSKSVKLRRSP